MCTLSMAIRTLLSYMSFTICLIGVVS
jgi:hypothetical protein